MFSSSHSFVINQRPFKNSSRFEMVLKHLFLLTTILVSSCYRVSSLSCGRLNPDPECLDVFTHEPSHLPKCYCTDLCEENLKTLVPKCASNELHADGCGACLVCARARGEKCGGNHNVLGLCASGMVCKINIPANAQDRDLAEQEAVGICVGSNSPDCPKSTDSAAERRRKRNISCRPGKTGIVAEALYCPSTLKQPEKRREKLPTLLEILLEGKTKNQGDRRRNGGLLEWLFPGDEESD